MDLFSTVEAAFVAFLGGLAPALLWLAFWLLESWKKPEPRRFIFFAFVSGMATVFLVLPFQALAAAFLPVGAGLLFIWAAIEELLKLFVAWFVVLRRRTTDRPIDMPLYLITTALGFAALENALFLFHPVADGQFLQGAVTGDLRFIGATLMHVLSSSLIGCAFALVYYEERLKKIFYGGLGVILAILLHGIFNSLILSRGEAELLLIFLALWIGVVFLLLALERVKGVTRPEWWQKMFMERPR
jgi:RsiW-degrading membrane proteinase PrsW (M82 family)